jgi:hypothetical protein
MQLKAQRLGLGASSFSLSPFAAGTAGRKSLGQTEQLLYSRAKTAILEFDALMSKSKGVLDDQISTLMPMAAAEKLAALVRTAEAANPTDYAVFSSAQKDVDAVENINREVAAKLAPPKPAVAPATEPVEGRPWMMPLGVLFLTSALVWYTVDRK